MASHFLVPLGRSAGDPVVGLYREMNRMFDDFFGGGGSAASSGRQGGFMTMPSLDVHEKGNELCVAAELPGVRSSDVDVRLDGDVLTISGEKKSETEPQPSQQSQASQQGQSSQSPNYHVMERSYGRFTRSVQLPFTPDPEQVHADFENGVLTVRLQRNPQQQGSRRIEVRDAGAQTARIGDSTGSSTDAGSGQAGNARSPTSQPAAPQGGSAPTSGATSH